MNQIVQCTAFHKYICFVKENDCFPASGKVKDFGEFAFEFAGVEIEITCRYLPK